MVMARAGAALSDIVRANIRRRRRELGLRGVDMARVLGIEQSSYSRLETGTSELTVRQLALIAWRLNVDPAQLLQVPR